MHHVYIDHLPPQTGTRWCWRDGYRAPMATTLGHAVDVATARRLAADDAVVFCDVRFDLNDHDQGRREHRAGHIPTAVYVDLHTDLADPSLPDAGRHPLPTTTDFCAMLGRCGITPHTTVIAYDDHAGMFAARLWWMLRAVGHSRVAVMDGGLSAWDAAGYPTVADDDPPAPCDPYPSPAGWSGVADIGMVGAVSDGTNTTHRLVDVRAPERFRGETEPLDPVAGHIPGAQNLFNGTLVANGSLIAAEDLNRHFDVVDAPPIVYCGSGVAACHVLWAMATAGHQHSEPALLYPGSWSHWCSDPDRPVATGDETASADPGRRPPG